MYTNNQFMNLWNKSLSEALAEKYELDQAEVWAFIKAHKFGKVAKATSKPTTPAQKKSPAKKAPKAKPTKKSDEGDDFEPFGRFKTMKTLTNAHEKAVKEGKYVNAKTGSVVQDSTRNRNAGIVFYDSNVCGEEDSEELDAILVHFPGSLVEAEVKAKSPKASPKAKAATKAKKAAKKEEPESDDEGEPDFVPFGKFKTVAKLSYAHMKAADAGKYVNATSGSIIQDNAANRKKGIVFYDSNVAGMPDSEELEEILKWWPGEEVVIEEEEKPKKQTKSKASAKKKTLKPKEEEAAEVDLEDELEDEEEGVEEELEDEEELEFEDELEDEE